MRTSNILMIPSQYNQPGYPGNYSRSLDSKKVNENMNILPPLDYKNHNHNFSAGLNGPNPFANQRQLSAAPVLPNLKSVMESLSNENVPVIQNSTNNMTMTIIGNTSKSNQQSVPQQQSSSTSANLMNNQYVSPRNIFYPPKFNLNSPIKFIINRGITIYQGDHVSIRGSDSQVYFAIVMDFWLTENGKRYYTLRWLLPKPKASITSALQDRFDLGPIHQRVEAMETILDVFYSPYRDQMTAENIRRKFLLPSSLNDDYSSRSSSNSNSETVVSIAVDPPVQLIKAIKSLSEDLESSKTGFYEKMEVPLNSIETSPSSKLFKSSEEVSQVPINSILNENSEIAAKMLLSMN